MQRIILMKKESNKQHSDKLKGLKRTFRSLKYRNCRLFFSGQSISLIGTWIQRIAMPWMVYRLTGYNHRPPWWPE